MVVSSFHLRFLVFSDLLHGLFVFNLVPLNFFLFADVFDGLSSIINSLNGLPLLKDIFIILKSELLHFLNLLLFLFVLLLAANAGVQVALAFRVAQLDFILFGELLLLEKLVVLYSVGLLGYLSVH